MPSTLEAQEYKQSMITTERTLSYKGVVYIYRQTETGERILVSKHNEGTIELARLFAYALVGMDVTKLVPQYLNIFDNNDVPVLTSNKELTARHVEYGHQDLHIYNDELPYLNYRAYFECMIGRNDIRANSAQRARKVSLLGKNQRELAFITLDNEDELTSVYDSNDNLVVIWQMELIYDKPVEEVPDEYR